MFKEQQKMELQKMVVAMKNIDKELVQIKIALHTLDKLTIELEAIESGLEDTGIEFYKLKEAIIKKVESFKF